ncbi:Holin of 3TMs, for gene-transfer release [Paracoccus sanguinis]|uniref:Holin of 3TMs, for gene-transfer release n=1 Tax=Paracoccus sanguinis TaxID=1545044 RepID=A0A1H2RD51_9RHOB|nr:Holin of 3TMs, for gene-transfer release [Paracoccus sanguinis]
MGMIDRFLGAGATVTAVGNAASGMAQILTPSATRRMELDEEAYARAIAEHQAEFAGAGTHWFDALMNGLNRLPRPLLTLGTIGLFVYAMVEPVGFSARMQGLALVPEPLWWLMGAIVSFYFGAREAHYFRHRVWPRATVRARVTGAAAAEDWRAPVIPGTEAGEDNWRAPILPGFDAAAGAAATVEAEIEERLDEPSVATPEVASAPATASATTPATAPVSGPATTPADDFADNAALRDWAAARRGRGRPGQ